MGFTSEKLEQAIKVLKARGHVIPAYPNPAGLASVGPRGLMVTVDGQLRTAAEIYAMMADPPDPKTKH
jgi:hypothetical protein